MFLGHCHFPNIFSLWRSLSWGLCRSLEIPRAFSFAMQERASLRRRCPQPTLAANHTSSQTSGFDGCVSQAEKKVNHFFPQTSWKLRLLAPLCGSAALEMSRIVTRTKCDHVWNVWTLMGVHKASDIWDSLFSVCCSKQYFRQKVWSFVTGMSPPVKSHIKAMKEKKKCRSWFSKIESFACDHFSMP